MTNLTPEQRVLGRENANRALGGLRRRDLLKAAAATPALGAFYFGYEKLDDKPPVRAAIIGTGNEGCQAMIRDHNREYVDIIGFCDIRPSQQARAWMGRMGSSGSSGNSGSRSQVSPSGGPALPLRSPCLTTLVKYGAGLSRGLLQVANTASSRTCSTSTPLDARRRAMRSFIVHVSRRRPSGRRKDSAHAALDSPGAVAIPEKPAAKVVADATEGPGSRRAASTIAS